MSVIAGILILASIFGVICWFMSRDLGWGPVAVIWTVSIATTALIGFACYLITGTS